jgi:hypothetical protein
MEVLRSRRTKYPAQYYVYYEDQYGIVVKEIIFYFPCVVRSA